MAGYGSDEGFADWLEANGHVLPESAPSPAILRQRGSDYLDGLYGPRLPGYPTDGVDQERAWPRTGATASGQPIGSDVIPTRWTTASYFAVFQEAISPGSLTITATGSSAVKREKIDAIETEYFEASGDVIADGSLRLSAIEGLVASFLKPSSAALSPLLFAVG